MDRGGKERKDSIIHECLREIDTSPDPPLPILCPTSNVEKLKRITAFENSTFSPLQSGNLT